MELHEIFAKRRSYRAFTNEPIPKELLEQILKAAQAAPNSCNLQITQFIVINDQDLLKQLVSEVSYKFGYSPCCIVAIQDSSITVSHSSGTITTGMMLENMILQATELGLGTCPMAGFSGDEKIKRILKIPHHLSVMLLLAVGYPDLTKVLAPRTKISPTSVYTYNTYAPLKSFNTSNDLNKISVSEIADYRERIAPIYLDRWRLAVLKPHWFDLACDFIKPHIKHDAHILDLISYDGEFTKRLINLDKKHSITVSDYIPLTTQFLTKEFGCSSIMIDFSNQILTDKKFDIISLIYKAEHTPNCEDLIKSSSSKLSDDGFLYVAIYHETFIKKWLKVFVAHKNKWKTNTPINIYEQNAFYRIGPYSPPTNRQVNKWLKKAGFRMIKTSNTKIDSRGGYAIFYLAQKLTISQ
jgi:nitroreductase/2-polyprenyl-3-methyl-5-hydroxy-6-metoxy-1,4-benzoquinol methylase